MLDEKLKAELELLAKKYRPRNDVILLKTIDGIKSEGGVIMPDVSAEGKANFIVAVGPKVEDLKFGDRVLIIGAMNETVVQLPRERGVYATRETNCLLAIN